MSSYTLTYFQIRGRAEAARIIAAEGQIKITNKTETFQSFPAVKGATPFGQLPVLESEDGSLKIAQSMTIARYLAKKANLVPTNLEDAAVADMYVDGIMDAVNALVQAMFHPTDKAGKTKEFVETKLPFFLEKFEGFLKKAGGEFFVAGKLTWADLVIFEFLETAVTMNSFESFPTLKAFKDAIAARPRIAAYISSPDRLPQLGGK